jgi:hypothetical protein
VYTVDLMNIPSGNSVLNIMVDGHMSISKNYFKVTLFKYVKMRCLRETHLLQLQGRRIIQARTQHESDSSVCYYLHEATCFSEGSFDFQHNIRCYTRFVPKVNVLIFLCTTLERSISLMYIGGFVMTLPACRYLFKLDRLSLS